MTPRINLSVIGHLDHGKSTLIGRILYDSGALPKERVEEVRLASESLRKDNKSDKDLDFAFFLDSLREERIDALTMDTTQAHFRTKRYEYNLIDCPGHKEFVKNMLTGASQAQAAILVVSAKLNEGVQEQTRTHILLAKMLGIRQLFVAVNKMDIVGYNKERFKEIKYEINEFLKANNYYRDASFIPISAKKGDNLLNKSDNINWYKGKSLVELLNKEIKIPTYSKSKALRVLIQDIYDDEGKKVLTGRIESGVLKRNDNLFLNISKQAGRVVSLVGAKGNKKKAVAGECVSLQLLGVDYDRIRRGEVGSSLYDTPRIKERFFAQIFVFGKNLNKNDKLIIRCGTAEKNCKIKKIIRKSDCENLRIKREDAATLKKDDVADVEMVVDGTIVVERFSKFPSLGRFLLIKKDKISAFGIVK